MFSAVLLVVADFAVELAAHEWIIRYRRHKGVNGTEKDTRNEQTRIGKYIARQRYERDIRKDAAHRATRKSIKKREGREALREFDRSHDTKEAVKHVAKQSLKYQWSLMTHGPTVRSSIRLMPKVVKSGIEAVRCHRSCDEEHSVDSKRFARHIMGIAHPDVASLSSEPKEAAKTDAQKGKAPVTARDMKRRGAKMRFKLRR